MEAQDQNARDVYTRAVLTEREQDVYIRTLAKVQVITRSMQPEEKEAYFQSKSFRNALQQTRKKDRTYQMLLSGELPENYQIDFERLQSLIEAEVRAGNPIDLVFLRSVQRVHQPLKNARQARACLEGGKADVFFQKNTGRLVMDMDRQVAAYLVSCDMAEAWNDAASEETVLDGLMHTLFSQGIRQAEIDHALSRPVSGFLSAKLCREYPNLLRCAAVRIDEQRTIASLTQEKVQAVLPEIVRIVCMRFSRKRIRKLLSQNQSIQTLQAQADRKHAQHARLREALVRAVPEEFKDLYPMARRMHRRFVLHIGPTNSGKTWESMQRLHAARCGIYLGPLRLLAFEQFETLNLDDIPCSLITGEEQILVPQSRVQSSTIEMADLNTHYDVAVIDEAQMISDRDRGGAWSAAILGLCADELHVCASPEAENLLCSIIRDCGDSLAVVHHERMAPLVVEDTGFQFPESVRKGDALIVFAKARVHALAAELKQLGFQVSLIYGALPPDVRRNQAERFRRGETDVVVSTDAIAMGMNLPIARVVFMESEKYDGDITRPLTDSEIRQIAGRAGRYGQYDVGYVNAFGFKQVVAHALSRPFLPLTHAVIRFPESLLGLPLPLTEIINRWISMKDKGYFSKASTMRMNSLASRMETRNSDKHLLYEFLCIPFDETDPLLLSEWKAMYHAEASHEHYNILSVLPEYRDPEACRITMLDKLEEDYTLCDLYYNYARRFLEDPEKLLEEIQLRKDLISSGIIHILSTQKLLARTCRKCGRHLPWNWPYTVCDHCHKTYAYGHGDWDEE